MIARRDDDSRLQDRIGIVWKLLRPRLAAGSLLRQAAEQGRQLVGGCCVAGLRSWIAGRRALRAGRALGEALQHRAVVQLRRDAGCGRAGLGRVRDRRGRVASPCRCPQSGARQEGRSRGRFGTQHGPRCCRYLPEVRIICLRDAGALPSAHMLLLGMQ